MSEQLYNDMTTRQYCVYKHTSPEGKSYIGYTGNLARRDREHSLMKGTNKAFTEAIQKYGWDNFTHEVLVSGLTEEEALEMEVLLIDKYGSFAPGGYNGSRGGSGYEMQSRMYAIVEQLTGQKHPVLVERGKGWEEYDKRRAEHAVWMTALNQQLDEHKQWWDEHNRWKRKHKLEYIATLMSTDIMRARLDKIEQNTLYMQARLGID